MIHLDFLVHEFLKDKYVVSHLQKKMREELCLTCYEGIS